MREQEPKRTAEELAGRPAPLGLTPLYVGLRYLLKKWLSFLAVLGVAVAVGTLIVVMSVMSGFHQELSSAIRGWNGDLDVRPMSGTPYSFKDWSVVREELLKVDHVKAAAPYIAGVGMIQFTNIKRTQHMFFRGIDPRLELEVSRFDVDTLGLTVRGAGTRLANLDIVFTDSSQAQIRSCMIGRAMAEIAPNYRLPIKSEVVLITVDKRLRARVLPHIMTGVFETGRYDYDKGSVLLSLENAIRLVNSDGGITGLHIRLDDYANAKEAVAAIREKLGEGFIIMTWEQLEWTFLEAVAMERFLMALILSFVGVLAGFCIFAILTITVAEKRRDIGILQTIGFARRSIALVFLFDGAAIGITGALVGAIGGLAFSYNINSIADFVEELTGWTPFPEDVYVFTEIPVDKGALAPILIALGAILCSLAFSVLPALRAARLDPIETLRYE